MAKKNSSAKATSKKTAVKKQSVAKKQVADRGVAIKDAAPKSEIENSIVVKKAKVDWANIKKIVKLIFKWLLIAAIIFFFVGGTVISAWMSDRDQKKKQEQQAEIQKQIEEYKKKVKEQEDAKPKDFDLSFKVKGDITDLKIIDEKTGDGTEVKATDKLKVKYKGALATSGEVFDKNQDAGLTVDLDGGVIKGWTEGLTGMKVGGIRRLEIPADKAYGEEGNITIPANADLVFTVELLEINPAQ